MKTTIKFWIGIAILAILSPLGLIIPAYFKAGPASGEWGKGGSWKAPMPNYAFKGWEEKSMPQLSFAYIISALLGVGIIAAAAFILGKILSKKDSR